MANSPIEISTHFFKTDDGIRLAWHEAGEGRPMVLFHGLFSNAHTNWVKYGAVATIVARGVRLIMPDLRAHGQSDAPHDASAYTKDILARDGLALLRHLGLNDGDYDLGGYSLGGRTTARMLIHGARPGKAVLAGMGLQGMLDAGSRIRHFRHVLEEFDAHPQGSGAWMAAQFLRTTGGDPKALIHILDTFVDSTEAELRAITTPALVISGNADDDNGSTEALAALLPNAIYATIPGNHMSAVTKPELGEAIASFLAG